MSTSNVATENLFLLEFLVDKVCIDPKWGLQDNLAGLTGETCVQFRFLNNEPLDVCEADFTPKNCYASDGKNYIRISIEGQGLSRILGHLGGVSE